MIRVKISDNKCLEDIMNDFISSASELPEVQSQLRDEDEYMKLQATVGSLKEAMAGCPEAALMEAFEDALYWITGYEINAAYLDGCNAALYSRRKKHFIFDSINTITASSFR